MFFGSDYGSRGGHTSLAETAGQFAGFEKAGDLQEKDAQRKRAQEEWNFKADALTDQAMQRKMQMGAQREMMTGDKMNLDQISEEVKALRSGQKKQQAKEVSDSIMSMISSPNPYEETKKFNNKLQKNPEIAKQLGLKSPHVELATAGSKNDMDMMKSYLVKLRPELAGLPESELERLSTAELNSGLFWKGDGKLVDGYGMATGMGAMNTASATQSEAAQRKREGVMKEVTNRSGKSKTTDTVSSMSADTKAELDKEPMYDPAVQPNVEGSSTDDYLLSKEQGNYEGDMYTRENMAGSSAYGKYQVIDDTNATVSKRLGMTPEEGRTPEGQEAVYKELKREYKGNLQSWGQPETSGNMYAVHQLGGPRAKRYFDGDLTSKDIKVMNDNLPAKLKSSNPDEIVANWTDTYVTPGNLASDDKPAQAMDKVTAGTPEGTDTPGQSWRDQPYQAGGTNRDQMVRKLAGLSDNSTAMTKDLDYIAQKLPEDQRTMGNVMDVYEQIKGAGKNDKEYSWEKAIDYKRSLLQQDIANGVISEEDAVKELRTFENDMMIKETSGKKAADMQGDIRAAGGQQKFYDNVKNVGLVKRADMLGRIADEKGIPQSADDKAAITNMKGYANISQNANRLATVVEDLEASGKLNKGLVDQTKQMAQEYMSTGALSEESKEALYATAGADTQVRNFVAEYLKFLSGAAVTETERKDVYGQLGNLFGIQPGVMAQRLRGFADSSNIKVEMLSNDLGASGFGGTAIKGLVDIGKITQVDGKGAAIEAKKYSKPMQQPNSPTASSQVGGNHTKDFQQFKSTPDMTWTNPKDGVTYRNENGTPVPVQP